jgi:acyl-CoA reductase-like NAD-dependent aldehyde dehydrogenase
VESHLTGPVALRVRIRFLYATHFKRHTDAGMVMVNVPTADVDFHVPYGGRRGSSYGPREPRLRRREMRDRRRRRATTGRILSSRV